MTVTDEGGAKSDVSLLGVGGVPEPAQTLYYDMTPDRETHMVVARDNMRVYLKIIPGAVFSGVSVEDVVSLLADAGVKVGIIGPGVSLFVAMQNSAAPYDGYFQVARGEPMRKGVDGSIEFHVQPTSLAPRYDENDSGGIDFKQLNLIENCFAGQRVASILPPGPGRAGTDVFGGEIPPVPGNPINIRAGAGVVISASGREFTSEIEGRVVYEDGILSVSPELVVDRDVDYSVGNIDFVGRIVVKGSLLDGFYINAKQGVEITGEMGAARISTDGDVTITGGVKGKSAAIITCRSLKARYLDEVVVEASGNVTVENEIINSSVKALGRLSIPGGGVIGGDVCGFLGIDAGSLGSDMGVATWVMAGLNWTDENKMEEIRGRIAEYLDRVQSSRVLLEPLFEADITALLSAEQKSMLSEVISELRDIRENLSELLREREGVAGRKQDGMVNQINVQKQLHHGVTVRFSKAEEEIQDSVKGPVTLAQDAAGDKVIRGALAELPEIADAGAGGEEGGEGEPSAADGAGE